MEKKAACAALALAAGAAFGATTIDTNHPCAYSANAGWVNARGNVTTGVVVGLTYCSGYAWGANIGWLNLGNGAPANQHTYANTSASDYGVNHDGAGNLRGCAWGQNVGWIAFEDTGDPEVDLVTGNLSGCAWGANIGWIGLSNALAYVRTERLDTGPDSDVDGLPDPWEYSQTNTLAALSGGTNDFDGDGATDNAEFGTDTDPLDGNDNLRIVAFECDGSTNTVAWTARPTRLYRLDLTNELPPEVTNAWADSGCGLIGPTAQPAATQEVTGATEPARLYRVRAVIPLQP
jgi:hypothetical protein